MYIKTKLQRDMLEAKNMDRAPKLTPAQNFAQLNTFDGVVPRYFA